MNITDSKTFSDEVAKDVMHQHQDVTKLAKGASVNLFGRIGGRGLHIITQILLARILGPSEFGLYAIGWTILRMASLLAPLGLDNGVLRFSPQYLPNDLAGFKGLFWKSFGIATIAGSIIGLTLFLGSTWVAREVFNKSELIHVFQLFAPAFIFASGLRVAAATTRASQRMRYSVYAQDISQPASSLIFLLVSIVLGWGLNGAITVSVLSFGVGLLVALYYIKKLYPHIVDINTKAEFIGKELIKYSLPTSFAAMFTMFILWVDRLLVGYFRSSSDVGIYQAASQYSLMFAIILSAFSAMFTPMISDLYHKKESGRLAELYRVSTKWGLYLSIPFFLVIMFHPIEAMTVVFGNEYAEGAVPLVILSLGQLVNIGTGEIGYLMMMTGHQNRWFITAALMLGLNIILNVILIPILGMTGAAIGTACSISSLYFGGLYHVKKLLGFFPYDKRYIRGIIATGIASCILLLFSFFDFGSSIIGFVMNIIAAVMTFGASLYFLGLDVEDKNFIQSVKARIAQKSNNF